MKCQMFRRDPIFPLRLRTESMVARVKKFLRKLLRIQVRDHPVWHWGLVRTHERLKEIVSKYASAN
jgi:hypothetical protein